MFCQKCGKKVPDDGVFCPSCGHKITGSEHTAVSNEHANLDTDHSIEYNYKSSYYEDTKEKKSEGLVKVLVGMLIVLIPLTIILLFVPIKFNFTSSKENLTSESPTLESKQLENIAETTKPLITETKAWNNTISQTTPAIPPQVIVETTAPVSAPSESGNSNVIYMSESIKAALEAEESKDNSSVIYMPQNNETSSSNTVSRNGYTLSYANTITDTLYYGEDETEVSVKIRMPKISGADDEIVIGVNENLESAMDELLGWCEEYVSETTKQPRSININTSSIESANKSTIKIRMKGKITGAKSSGSSDVSFMFTYDIDSDSFTLRKN